MGVIPLCLSMFTNHWLLVWNFKRIFYIDIKRPAGQSDMTGSQITLWVAIFVWPAGLHSLNFWLNKNKSNNYSRNWIINVYIKKISKRKNKIKSFKCEEKTILDAKTLAQYKNKINKRKNNGLKTFRWHLNYSTNLVSYQVWKKFQWTRIQDSVKSLRLESIVYKINLFFQYNFKFYKISRNSICNIRYIELIITNLSAEWQIILQKWRFPSPFARCIMYLLYQLWKMAMENIKCYTIIIYINIIHWI